MSFNTQNKGVIDKIPNKKLESLLNLLGVVGTAKKIGVSPQGLYKNMQKRGSRTKTIYVLGA